MTYHLYVFPGYVVIISAIGGVLAVVLLAALIVTTVWVWRYCRRTTNRRTTISDDSSSDSTVMYVSALARRTRLWKEHRGSAGPAAWQTSPYDYANMETGSKTNIVSCSWLSDTR